MHQNQWIAAIKELEAKKILLFQAHSLVIWKKEKCRMCYLICPLGMKVPVVVDGRVDQVWMGGCFPICMM